MGQLIRKLFILCLCLGGLSGAAWAGQDVLANTGTSTNVWTVYAFGNAQAIADAFKAVANFTNSSMFSSLFTFIAVTGVIVVVLTGGFHPGNAKKFIGYIVSVMLVSYIFTGFGSGGLTIKVEVEDPVTGAWKTPQEVPVMLGVPAALISTVGHEITKQIEASFMIPDELKISNGAPFNLSASLISDASKARITNPSLANSLAYYMQDCFVPALATGAISPEVLKSSTKFLEDIKYPNQALMVNTSLNAGGPPLVSCLEAHNLIVAAAGAGTGTTVDSQGKVVPAPATASDFLNSASAWATTPAFSVVNSAADAVAFQASHGTVSGGGAAMVKQAAVLAAYKDSHSTIAAATGNSEFLSALAIEQAKSSQFNSWVVGAEVFNRTMGYIYSILQVFVYAIAPFVLMAVLVPGVGGSLLKSFVQVLMWLAMWPPLLAVVNFVVLAMQQEELGGLLNSGDGFGFTLGSMGIISEKTANMRAAASVIGSMVPLLAWGMVKGAIDLTKFVATAAGEQFAGTAANTLATGNYSLNQGSMDSFTANKHSISQTAGLGNGFSVNDGALLDKQELGGATVTAGGVAPSVQTTVRTGVNEQQGVVAGTNVGSSASAAQSAAAAVGAAHAVGTGAAASNINSASFNKDGGVGASFTAGYQGGSAPGAPGGAPGTIPGGSGVSPGVLGNDSVLVNQLTPAQRAAALAKKAIPKTKLDGSINTGVRVQQGTQNQVVDSNNKSDTSNRTNTKTDVLGSQKVAGQSVNTTQGVGTDNGASTTITGLPNAIQRAEVNRMALGEDSGLFGRAKFRAAEGTALHKELYGYSSPEMQRAADMAANPYAMAEAQKNAEGKVARQVSEANKQEEDMKAKAKEKARAAELEALSQQFKGTNGIDNTRNAVNNASLMGLAGDAFNKYAMTKEDAVKYFGAAADEVMNIAKTAAPAAAGAAAVGVAVKTAKTMRDNGGLEGVRKQSRAAASMKPKP